MKFNRTIGILGGVGPAASAYALNRLISICQHEYQAMQDNDFPNIVLTSFPAPNVTELGVTSEESTHAQVLGALEDGYRTLSAAGADLVYTACNTLSLKSSVFTELHMRHISIIEETADYIAATHPNKRVIVLSSASTRAEKLYADQLNERSLRYVPISDETQASVTELIAEAMRGTSVPAAKRRLRLLCNRLLGECDCVVLGCTELSLLADQRIIGEEVIDPQEIAIRVMLKEACS